MTFAEQLTLSRQGDQQSLDGLFSRWRPLLRLQARRLLGAELSARVDPSDVLQDTLTQAFEDLNQFRGQNEGEWVAWLRSITAGQAAKVQRRHHALKRDQGREDPLMETISADSAASPLSKVIDNEDALRLAAALESLPHDMREVIMRRIFDLEPFDVVAKFLGRTPGATRVLWTRALRKLRDLLETTP